MKKTSVFFATLLSVSPTIASSNVDNFRVCRDALPPVSQEIANRVAAQLKPGVDAKQIMKSTVIKMVENGELERRIARQSATSAADCLLKLKD